jgi:hypothetical protein
MFTISSPTLLTETHDAELKKNCTEDGLRGENVVLINKDSTVAVSGL